MISLPTYPFEHGEVFGKVTYLHACTKAKGKCIVGCACGWRFRVRKSQLRKGLVKGCLKCAGKP